MNIRIINLKGQKEHVWKAIDNRIDNRKLKIIIWVFGCSIFEYHILLSNLALCCIFRSSRAMSLSMILFCISSSFWFSDARNKKSWVRQWRLISGIRILTQAESKSRRYIHDEVADGGTRNLRRKKAPLCPLYPL